ncbi:plant glycogenin-like starch initiation protein 2, partial [Genlisea aurea]
TEWFGTGKMYASVFEINWSDVAVALEELSDSGEFKGTGYLNFDEEEMNRWNDIFPDSEHVPLVLDHVPSDVTWEALYPEWIDEEEEFEVSACPALPRIRFHGKPRLDLIAVKLPCNRALNNWSRDVVRFHLQIEVARVAAMVKGYRRPVYVVLMTECFPMPNLFGCKDLVVRRGNVWVYKPEPDELRQKLRVPVGSCELAVALNDK